MNITYKNGFTLAESIIALSVLSLITVGVVSNMAETNDKDDAIIFMDEAMNVVSAVDQRLNIDGFNSTLWTTTNWNNENEVVGNLIQRTLTSNAITGCANGEWIPANPEMNELSIINCNQWDGRRPDGMEMSAQLGVDAVGFVDNFEFLITFEDDDSFIENFQDMKVGYNYINGLPYNELASLFFIDLVNVTTRDEITTSECLNQASNCGIRLSLERSGGYEYFRIDGTASMIDTNITFVETKGDAPLRCLRWVQNNAGVWGSTPLNEDCGVGIYSETGSPVAADIVVDNGTFENVLLSLENECNVYTPSANVSSDVVNISRTSPCGTLEDGTIIQVVNNTSQEMTLAESGHFNLLKLDNLIATTIQANELKVVNLAEFDTSTLTGYARIGRDTIVSGDLNIGGNMVVNGNFDVSGDITALNISADTMISAPIGDFANINAELARLDNKANSVEDQVDDMKGNWVIGSWGTCNVSCGGGFQKRTVYCPTGMYCGDSLPQTTRSCNTNACVVTDTTDRDQNYGACGNTGCGGGPGGAGGAGN